MSRDDGDGNERLRQEDVQTVQGHFADRITADGRDGWPVEAGRYRLVVSRACPWASRALVSRRLLGLEDALSLAVADPIQDDRSWRFTLDPDGRDPVLGIRYLSEAYDARETDYPGGVSVPAIVDVPSGQAGHQRLPAAHPRPRDRVDGPAPGGRARPVPGAAARRDRRGDGGRLRGRQQRRVPGGFRHRAGGVRGRLRAVCSGGWSCCRERLARQRYLVGDTITEADIRLFTTLVRFDAVYHGHFKCNRWKLAENQVLWAYVRDLFQTPGFGDTVDFDHIKRHYYQVHTGINPTGDRAARARTCRAG